jgi:hypothetical protein
MKHNQIPHALWILLITILLNVHNVHASDVFCNIVSETDTASGTVSKSSSADTLDAGYIPIAEQKKIQEIKYSLADNKLAKNEDKKKKYIYKELGKAAHTKQLHVLDYLLSLNFEHDQYLLFNSSLAHIAGIPAARGDEDLAIIIKILNAKQSAFIRFGKKDEPQHKIEMTEISNRIIAFSATNNHYTLVQRILENTALICFDVNGVNWALRNIMRVQDSTKENQIIRLLYDNTYVKPDLEGTLDVLEMALESNNDKDLNLVLDIASNHHTISDILKEAMLNVHAHIVHKIINGKKDAKRVPDLFALDKNSKILAMVKFHVDSKKAASQADKEKATAIALEIRAEVPHYTMPLINEACCEFVGAVYKLHTKTNKIDSMSEYFKYITNRDRLKENMFPLFSFIHKEDGLKLYHAVYQKLIELWDDLLVKSSAFGDYQMGKDLLSEKHSIDFDQQTIHSAIDSINTCLQEYELPPAKKIKKEYEAPSESDVFLNLLKSKKIQ